ncbi:MAG: hypothetical protein GY862_39205, partial [Gammaproteobacteria bacterium]|nr:hypothetical protein [Gammaproteobacteria bacterium]
MVISFYELIEEPLEPTTPECNSDDIATLRKRKLNRCEECGYEWEDVHYTDAAKPDVEEFCKNLAASAHWVEKVRDKWPGPVAHEYHRLKEILEQGRIVSAILQTKDLAEVLIKFPAAVMAAYVLDSGFADTQGLRKTVQTAMLANPLSMGSWHQLAGDILAPEFCKFPDSLGKIACLFRNPKGKITPVYNLLKDLNEWRNNEIGHGALRLDVKEFQPELEKHIREINAVLKEYQDMWDGTQLVTESGDALQGWQTIRHRHDMQDTAPHPEEALRISLQGLGHRGRTALMLSPLLTLKRCTVCAKQDIFFFDSRKTGKGDK